MPCSNTIETIVLSPPELARRWRVGVDKILALIVRGDLPGAFNGALHVGPGKRPRWKIPLATVEQFEAQRAAVPVKRDGREEVHAR
jgi:hypothetical protein